jgi:hypothetical protein
MIAATEAGMQFLGAYEALEDMGPGGERGEPVQRARDKGKRADELENEVLDVIRVELHARTDSRPRGPLPRSRLGVEDTLAQASAVTRPDDSQAD